ncbi:MAG: phosphoesterase [Bradyrhizobiaceae bacterium PARB1]|nr:MAG: phosphoesterase [Bradyrhizobiaceae bacterium PARB1]
MKKQSFEVWPLAAMLGTAALVLVFGIIANLSTDGASDPFDRWLLQSFRDEMGRAAYPRWLAEAIRDVSALGSAPVVSLICGVVLGYLVMIRKRAAALLVLVAIAGGGILNNVLKSTFERPRPDFIEPLASVSSASFPSGHATFSAITYLTLAALLARTTPRLRLRLYAIAIGLLLTVLVGMTRVILGVHYPTDVLAGWCIGAAWSLLCWSVMLRLQRQGQVESANDPAQ